MLSKANLITINPTKKNHVNLQIIKVIDNAHNHPFIINFYAPPNHKHNALIELAEEIRSLDSNYSNFQLIVAGDYNLHHETNEIKNLCTRLGLTAISNEKKTRGNNTLDFFISKNILQIETSTGYQVGTSDHKYITLSFKTKGKLSRRLISAFPKSALKKSLKETNLEATISLMDI